MSTRVRRMISDVDFAAATRKAAERVGDRATAAAAGRREAAARQHEEAAMRREYIERLERKADGASRSLANVERMLADRDRAKAAEAVDAAIDAGAIDVAHRDIWLRAFELDAELARRQLAALQPDVLQAGRNYAAEADDDEYAAIAAAQLGIPKEQLI